MHSAQFKVDSSYPTGFPTAVAVPIERGKTLIGDEALGLVDSTHLSLVNWKMLLGKSTVDLADEKRNNDQLSKILKETNLDELAEDYFRQVLKQTFDNYPEMEAKPRVIVGIPPAASEEQKLWRSIYKKRIETIFEKLDFPKPKFFPEPFAVFQYYRYQEKFPSRAEKQNVVVVDIGGGTTDVCLIQTTLKGRLARGGVNCVPHGVKSKEIGGANLDYYLAKEHGLDGTHSGILQLIKTKRESLLKHADNHTTGDLKEDEFIEWEGKKVVFDIELIKRVFIEKVWPTINALLDDSIQESIKVERLTVENVQFVILAGGVCQIGFVQELIERKLRQRTEFKQTKFIREPDYKRAVAHGLAIEAAANSRHHKLAPTRISAYLQDDLKFECGHKNGDFYVPKKMKSKYKSQCDLAQGVILKGPMELDQLRHQPRSWVFNLKQDSTKFFYRFSKINSPNEEIELNKNWLTISRKKNQRTGRQLELSMTLDRDGFAKFEVDTTDNIRFRLKDPIDLHDLSDIEGDAFFGIDFGTDNTQIAYANVQDSRLLQPIPDSYRFDHAIVVRCDELVRELETLLDSADDGRESMLKKFYDQSLSDYVYHSNRIEGSSLDRGQTEEVLNSARSSSSIRVVDGLQIGTKNPGVIDEHGKVLSGKLIKDCGAAKNLRDACDFVLASSQDRETPIHGNLIRQIHVLTMEGETQAEPGKFRSSNVEIAGTTFVPPDHMHLNQWFESLLQRVISEEFSTLNPILQAVEAHATFVSIHPFMDGNGRVARLLANYFMWRRNLPGFLLPWDDREIYYDALEECNSNEPAQMGNLTDLAVLFCNVLEDAIKSLENQSNRPEDDSEGIPIIDEINGESNFGQLIERINATNDTALPLTFSELYDVWSSTVASTVSELKELSGQLSRKLRLTHDCIEVHTKDYPIIDIDTYRAICERKIYSKIRCLKIMFEAKYKEEELVFHFGPNSRIIEELEPALKQTCSIHISRLVPEELRHVLVVDQDWSRVIEITHDGSKTGVLVRNQNSGDWQILTDEMSMVENWFGILVEDLLETSFSSSLKSVNQT